MTPDEFGSALVEFAPEDTKVIMTSTSDTVVFSAIPRNKDSDSLPLRQFAVRLPLDSQIPKEAMDFARFELFPEEIKRLTKVKAEIEGRHKAEFDAKQAELTAAEEKSKERVAEKIETASKKTGARFKREIK